MSDNDLWFERPDDELRDEEFPDEDDLDDESSETVPCSECGAEIYEDAVRCPVCEAYVTHPSSVWSGRPLWWIALGLLGILAVIVVFLQFLR